MGALPGSDACVVGAHGVPQASVSPSRLVGTVSKMIITVNSALVKMLAISNLCR